MKRWSDFYETFWEELKQPFMNSLNQAETTFHEFVKPSKREQKISHIPKASSNEIIRKEGQR